MIMIMDLLDSWLGSEVLLISIFCHSQSPQAECETLLRGPHFHQKRGHHEISHRNFYHIWRETSTSKKLTFTAQDLLLIHKYICIPAKVWPRQS